MIPLSNETLKVYVSTNQDIGLLGILDTSDLVAVTLSYSLSLVDSNEIFGEIPDKHKVAPIIVFVIVICSVFGCLLIGIGCLYMIRVINSRKRTLIRMNNEIQFKRGDTFQKHPLSSDGPKQSSDEEKGGAGEEKDGASS